MRFVLRVASFSGRFTLGVASLLSVLLGGCRTEEDQQQAARSPDVVVAELLRRLRETHGGPEAGAKVVELLWEPARKNLQQRAEHASAVSGRELEVGEMIVPSWLSLHLPVEKFEWRREGEWAEVRGLTADDRAVTTRCVLEDGNWKVVLELPPVPPIRLREGEIGIRPHADSSVSGVVYP